MLTVKVVHCSQTYYEVCSFAIKKQVSGFHNIMAHRVGIFGNGTALHNLQISLSLFHTPPYFKWREKKTE